MCLLKGIYGSGVEKLRLEVRSFKNKSNKNVDISMVGSNYHLECCPSDAKNNDVLVIQEVIKEIASTGLLQQQRASSSSSSPKKPFKGETQSSL